MNSLAKRLEPYDVAVAAGVAFLLLAAGLWSYTLVDPWETHYAEVGRRMLADGDWVHLKWQNEVFRSKPVLTFWVIAASMWLFGVGRGGGYSGELVSDLTVFAVRLPFVLFAVLGVTSVFWMVKRLVGRRAAWLSFAIVVTTPFFSLVARQSITDMPLVGCLMAALSCFAVAVESPEDATLPKKSLAPALFFACFALFVGVQAVGYAVYLRGRELQVRAAFGHPAIWTTLVTAVPLLGFLIWRIVRPVVQPRQLLMYWFYFFIGISVLAKGPPGVGVAGAVCFFYLLLTGRFHLLAKLEVPIGLVIGALTSVPWHVAMWLTDGRAFINEYFKHHMFARFGAGVHGDRGSFAYYLSQLGIGMWTWYALLVPALCFALATRRDDTPAGRTRLLCAIWALCGTALFCLSQTKFHHYILPAVPALGILIAFWLDHALLHPPRARGFWAVWSIVTLLLVIRDVTFEQKQFIELFTYKYDRPWPTGAPWYVDLSPALYLFGAAALSGLSWFFLSRHRRPAVLGLCAVAFGFSAWICQGYMSHAAAHWGQKHLHETYLARRSITGLRLHYASHGDFAAQWRDGEELSVRAVLPKAFAPGPGRFVVHIPTENAPLVVNAIITRRDGDRFFARATPTPAQAAQLADLRARGTGAGRRFKPPRIDVDADRLVSWELNWRGENFWSSGQIYGEYPEERTVFVTIDDAFKKYLGSYGEDGRRYFLITEAARVPRVPNNGPTPGAITDFRIEDTSCNKFTLVSFVYRSGPPETPLP